MATKKKARAAKAPAKKRRAPGTGPDAAYYRIEVRPRRNFASFRTQDVGEKGGLERVAGKRASGSWDTQAWLVSKDIAHLGPSGELIIDNARDRAAIESAISGKIERTPSGIFKAHPAKNIPEKDKPTPAMKRAWAAARKGAPGARKK